MHAKISLLGSTAAINAVIAAAVSNGVTLASVELSVSDGDSLDGLSLVSGSAPAAASPATETASTPIPAPVPAPPTSTDSDDEDEGDDTDGSGLDADGLPWDERIHSSSKKRGRDGTWNKRRGGPKGEELAAIEAELRAGMTGGEQSQAPSAPPMPAAPVAPPPVPQAPAAPPPVPQAPAAPVAPPPVPQAPAAPVAPPPVPQAPAAPVAPPPPPVPEPAPAAPAAQPEQPADIDFPTFMSQIGPKLGESEGQIGAQYLAEVCQSLGINTMTDLALKPELIGPFVAQLTADGRW